MQVINSSGEILTLAPHPLAAGGGEGQVHKILSPVKYKNNCVKIFYTSKRGPERENRIYFMLMNKPQELKSPTHIVCWPVDFVKNDKEFLGFVMPLADEKSISLNFLCLPEVVGLPDAAFWNNKYTRNAPQGFISRLKLCANLAVAVHRICSIGYYVLGDMKPQNVRVTHDGVIFLLDTDSIQISNDQKLLFKAGAITPDYAPPEIMKCPLSATWDRFSIAVVFYQIMLGIHPFASIPVDELGEFTSFHNNISHGLFPYGSNKNKIKSFASRHKSFDKIPASLQRLFLKTFEDGLNQPELRTSIEDWGTVFYREAIKLEKAVKVNISTTHTPSPPKLVGSNSIKNKPRISIGFGNFIIWLLILLSILMFVIVLTPGLDVQLLQWLKLINQ